MITDMIKKHDEPALRRLIDVTVRYDVGHAFKLEFHFELNQFFDNSVLTKKYFLRSSIDQNDPFAYEGHEVKSCQGCDIDWKDKMNLTVKTNNNTPVESFFNFFNSPQTSINNEDDDEYEEAKALQADYKIGHFLRIRVIPKAVLYFTGDIVDKYGDEDKD
ncbi:nucleosome assembly protein 1-like 1 [Drosophila gunungcola]|nr:nucleosome assembly protein 1-like 1 [Drosophila gunungcola]